MTPTFRKLTTLLAELFQLDRADLDFGVYRIMNQKRDEVTRFLEHDLLPQVQEAFSQYQSADKAELEKELQEAIAGANALGVDAESVPKVQELRQQMSASVDVAGLEDEVYSDLYNFFRRYYKDGDFLSLRRYKEGVYAIPYEGEEVKLHWANADQYYIKSGETFRDYAFTLPDERRVRFKLVEADTELGNNKAQQGGERRFILCNQTPHMEQDGELVLRFEYRPDADKRKQAKLNTEAVQRLLNDPALRAWGGLSQERGTEKNPKRTLLEKHLTDYTAKNTFDYFIHKDLGGFLRRELDFFIKNEIMHLDDIENDTVPRVEQYLSKIRVLRRIAHKIIRFLEQLENFQKKLWLKKKFVVATDYCMTLDRVPEALYADICENDAQREEWVQLFAIDEIKPEAPKKGQQASLFDEGGDGGVVAYSAPLTVEFLKANPFLVLDTKFFDVKFKQKLLAGIDDLDEQCDGVLVHAENFGALQLLQERYRERVKCVYIDPPYNTKGDEFPYKDNYQHSSWLSMIFSRSMLAKAIMSDSALFFAQIGDDEASRLKLVLDDIFPSRKNTAVVRRGIKNVQAQFSDIDKLNAGHDLIHIYSKAENNRVPHLKQLYDEGKPGKWDTFWRGTDRPTMRYSLFGKTPPSGQWRWEVNRATQAIRNHQEYMENEAQAKTLDEWYTENLQCGIDLDFVKRSDDGVVQYYVPPQNYRLVSDNWLDIPASGSFSDFPHEKSNPLLQRTINWNSSTQDTTLDFFAGSGSTAHAVINLNRQDNGARKYILVEMGEYFNTVLKPRIQKVIYSDSWKDGKPVSRQGSSHMFKYLKLESYEDALNNLEMKRTHQQQLTLDMGTPGMREEYVLSYMLDVETKDSPSLLKVDAFEAPHSYALHIATGTAGETKTVNVDLVETFNYLLGLTVKTVDVIRGFTVITGLSPKNERVLVIWRNTKEKTNANLDAFFNKQGYNTRDMEFDIVYVNGDNNLENLRRADQTWKVRLIEEDFKRLMFDVEDV